MPAEPNAAALGAGDLGDVAAQLGQRVHDVAGGPADRRRHLEHRLHQLRVDAVSMLAVLDRREHRVDVLHEVPRLGVEQHVLLLDAERVRVALAERVIEHARVAGAEPLGALPGDRRREDLLHGVSITASASISTSQRGSSSAVTIPVVAGRASRKRFAVRAADLVDVRRVRDVDAGSHDVVQRRAGLRQRTLDDREAHPGLLVRRRRAGRRRRA